MNHIALMEIWHDDPFAFIKDNWGLVPQHPDEKFVR